MIFSASALCLAQNAPAKKVAGTPHVYKVVDGRELKLYVVNPPDNEPNRPALVTIHGGGWVSGTPTQFNERAEYFASRGMVTVLVEYRLAAQNTNEPPIRCIHDVKSAMRWVRSHAAELRIDPNRIAASGSSAGSHLAAFCGMVDGMDDPQDDLKISAKPNALILFVPVFNNGPGQWGHARVGERYREFSPAHNITPDDPPTIIFAGAEDKLIPVKVVEDFAADMKKAGVRCETHFYEGQGHNAFGFRATGNRYYDDTLILADKFLASLGWLQGPPTWHSAGETVSFDDAKTGELPANWEGTATGDGKPQWSIAADDSAPSKPNVLKQSGEAKYPVCVKTDSSLKDGFVEVKFKPISGKEDQAGGVVWRYRDENNYYIARANALEDNVVLYKVEDGKRKNLDIVGRVGGYGIKEPVPKAQWSTLRVNFSGDEFTVIFNGKELFRVKDSTFKDAGNVGVWTKADSVTLFDDFRFGENR